MFKTWQHFFVGKLATKKWSMYLHIVNGHGDRFVFRHYLSWKPLKMLIYSLFRGTLRWLREYAHQEEFDLFYLAAVSFSHETCSIVIFHRMVNKVFHNNLKSCFFLCIPCSFESELTVQTSRYTMEAFLEMSANTNGALFFSFSHFET